MKKCPYCGRENDDSAAACSECQTGFASPEMPEDRQQLEDPALSLVVVATFRNVVDAGMFNARLEAAGIETCVPEEYTPQMFWNVIPSPLESVTVRVAAKDYQTAKGLFDDYADSSISASLPLAAKAESAPTPKAALPETEERESADLGGKKLCVSCKGVISETAELCPRCGWTQPDVG